MEIYDMFMKNRQLLGAASDRLSVLDKPTLSERAMIVTIDCVRAEMMREIEMRCNPPKTIDTSDSKYDPE